MPPKRSTNTKDAPAKKRVAAKGYKLPDSIPCGTTFTDLAKKQWRLGKSIGQGGFGEIYLASPEITKSVSDDADFVVKIEPHSNGPLFTEMHCYMRIAKPESIDSWKKEKKLKHLGMPKFLGSGSLEFKGQRYRFMIMERFGSDLQKVIDKYNKKFSYKTVCEVGMQILDALEYIHHYEYIHADIKASNLLVGHQRSKENRIFLVDFGLACRYMSDGKHKEYKYDQRKAHDGTIEFTSRDAHIGAHSRRGDLEILGYNLIQWLCGRLPWEDNLQDCNYVATQKRGYMDDVPKFMKKCFPDGVPPGIQEYTEYVANLTFDEKPNYEKCRSILRGGLKRRGYKDDGKLIFLSATPKPRKPASKLNKKCAKRSSDEENIGDLPPKIMKHGARFPCKPRNFISRNMRTCPRDSMDGISLSKPNRPEFLLDPEDVLVEKENQKMLARKQETRPKRLPIKKDTSLDNPTPQMLEIMAKIREKSRSPPVVCLKKHKHNGFCYQIARTSPTSEEYPTDLTYAMEDVLRNRERRNSSDSEFYVSGCSSPYESEGEEEDKNQSGDYNETVYYSPYEGSSSSSNEDSDDEYSNGGKKILVKRRSRNNGYSLRRRCARVTRSSSLYNSSPELF